MAYDSWIILGIKVVSDFSSRNCSVVNTLIPKSVYLTIFFFKAIFLKEECQLQSIETTLRL